MTVFVALELETKGALGVIRRALHQRAVHKLDQRLFPITSNHAKTVELRQTSESMSLFLQRLVLNATRLSLSQRWCWLLRYIFRDWLKNRAPDKAYLPLEDLVNSRI